MGIKVTELPRTSQPSPNTIILGSNIDPEPDESIGIPLEFLGKGIRYLNPDVYALGNNIFINITSNTHLISANDNGKILLVNNEFPTTIFLDFVNPSFSCSIIRLNNNVTVSNNGMILNSFSNSVNISSQFSSAALMCYSTNTFILYGDII